MKTDHLLRGLYSAGASCNNQSETSVAARDVRKFQTKLRPARTDKCPENFYPLLGYNSAFASDVSELIYVDRTITDFYSSRATFLT